MPLEYLMSPWGYENRIQCVCLADIGNSVYAVRDTQEDKDKLLQKLVKKPYEGKILPWKMHLIFRDIVYRSSSDGSDAWGLYGVDTVSWTPSQYQSMTCKNKGPPFIFSMSERCWFISYVTQNTIQSTNYSLKMHWFTLAHLLKYCA